MRENDSIRKIRGVGEKTEKTLNKLGLYTVSDMLSYYPREYDIFREPVMIAQMEDKEKYSVKAVVCGPVNVKNTGKTTIVTTNVTDGVSLCKMVWFHAPYLRNTLKRGMTFVFRGIAVVKNNVYSMEHPEIYNLAAYEQKIYSMQPVYALTAGIKNNGIVKMMTQILEDTHMEKDFLPESVIEEKKLLSHEKAVKLIHFPKDQEEYLQARKRLSYEEFLIFLLGLQKMKEQTAGQICEYSMKEAGLTERIIEELPYELTGAQKTVWKEIKKDLASQTVMARLIQGDVGSGKTILAFLAMIFAAENGYQSALMVPTEVLARQHFEALCQLLEKHKILEKYHPVLLTGSCTAKEKRNIYDRIVTGTAKMIVGTHALIQEKVEYRNLALVITDEQHRFGVCQRDVFSQKGSTPNVLVMSATPIPRTLGIILYGDLDISVIDELPAQRLPIKNCVVDTSFRPRAYKFIENQIREGHQAYVICPMVEESGQMEGENVTEYTQKLRQALSPDIRIEMLHGQMKPAVKNGIMEEFAEGRIQVLVSTTVVEVGVNVPNATVMMVENAERFGLAQLHQLRGRVGRGDAQSYCIFIHGGKGKNVSRRLKILEESNDGFYIAEEDLKLRGPGDMFGIRQSGILEFKIADIFRDADLLKDAGNMAGRILSEDYELEKPKHEGLKRELDKFTRGSINSPGI